MTTTVALSFIGLLPDWYCIDYARDRVTLTGTFLAFLEIFLRPIRRLHLDPAPYEAMSFLSCAFYSCWLHWGDSSQAHTALMRLGYPWQWQIACWLVLAAHVTAWWHWSRDARKAALWIAEVWWVFLLFTISRVGYLSTMGFIATIAILIPAGIMGLNSSGGGHGHSRTS